MNTEKINLAAAISLLESENNFGSIYTKQDVLNLLNRIQEGPKESLNLDRFVDTILECFEKELRQTDTDDFIDKDSANFDLNGNEIYLESIDVNSNSISYFFKTCVIDARQEFETIQDLEED